jgi:hypothetical protein
MKRIQILLSSGRARLLRFPHHGLMSARGAALNYFLPANLARGEIEY